MVANLVPPGVEPHDFELNPDSVRQIQSADIVVYNGLGLELWLSNAQNALQSNATMVDASNGITPRKADMSEGDIQAGISNDPHVWLDPVDAKTEATNIESAFEQKDPANAAYYQANLAALDAKLDALNSEYTTGLATCAKKDIITSHAAFGYMAKQYGLNQVSIDGLSPDAEPSPSQLANLTSYAKERNVTVIFFEALVNPALSDTLAREIGAKTMVLDPIEGLTPANQAAGKDYFSLMRENLANLRSALKCA